MPLRVGVFAADDPSVRSLADELGAHDFAVIAQAVIEDGEPAAARQLAGFIADARIDVVVAIATPATRDALIPLITKRLLGFSDLSDIDGGRCEGTIVILVPAEANARTAALAKALPRIETELARKPVAAGGPVKVSIPAGKPPAPPQAKGPARAPGAPPPIPSTPVPGARNIAAIPPAPPGKKPGGKPPTPPVRTPPRGSPLAAIPPRNKTIQLDDADINARPPPRNKTIQLDDAGLEALSNLDKPPLPQAQTSRMPPPKSAPSIVIAPEPASRTSEPSIVVAPEPVSRTSEPSIVVAPEPVSRTSEPSIVVAPEPVSRTSEPSIVVAPEPSIVVAAESSPRVANSEQSLVAAGESSLRSSRTEPRRQSEPSIVVADDRPVVSRDSATAIPLRINDGLTPTFQSSPAITPPPVSPPAAPPIPPKVKSEPAIVVPPTPAAAAKAPPPSPKAKSEPAIAVPKSEPAKVVAKDEPNVVAKDEPKVVAKDEPKVVAKDEPNVVAKDEPAKVVAKDEPAKDKPAAHASKPTSDLFAGRDDLPKPARAADDLAAMQAARMPTYPIASGGSRRGLLFAGIAVVVLGGAAAAFFLLGGKSEHKQPVVSNDKPADTHVEQPVDTHADIDAGKPSEAAGSSTVSEDDIEMGEPPTGSAKPADTGSATKKPTTGATTTAGTTTTPTATNTTATTGTKTGTTPTTATTGTTPATGSNTAATGTKTGTTTTTAQAKPVEAVSADGCDKVSCVIDNFSRPCCEPFRPRKANEQPYELDKAMITGGMAGVKAAVIRCGEQTATAKGIVRIAVQVAVDGHVVSTSVVESPDPALGECVAKAARLATFPKTEIGGSFNYPFKF